MGGGHDSSRVVHPSVEPLKRSQTCGSAVNFVSVAPNTWNPSILFKFPLEGLNVHSPYSTGGHLMPPSANVATVSVRSIKSLGNFCKTRRALLEGYDLSRCLSSAAASPRPKAFPFHQRQQFHLDHGLAPLRCRLQLPQQPGGTSSSTFAR